MKLDLLIKPKSFLIENFGCQMNVADSAEIRDSLLKNGYIESFDRLPDLIILNSCAVRASAEDRIYIRLKYYARLKLKKRFTLVLVGCVAQKEKENILKEIPEVDLVIGTHQKSQILQLVEHCTDEDSLNISSKTFYDFGSYKFNSAIPSSKYPFKSDVIIIHGCNKFCTYCIVPFTRGVEISRKSFDIISNVRELVDIGVSEILLLGQNVNSYGQDNNDIQFYELLYELNKISGLKRIRFLTSHPKDFSHNLIRVIKESNKVCKYIHLPLQSASNTVLKKMERDYTFEHYMNIIYELRKEVPHVVLSTDILVGFPYESEKDYEETFEAVKRIRFDTAFMFKYSIRSGTESSNYPDIVDEEEKKRRLQCIIDVQHQITKEQNLKDLGRTEEVLFESKSKNNPRELLGKTDGNKPVVIRLDESEIGKYKTIVLKSLKGNTFCGELIS